ncbi:class II histone deacetylase complex subunits 2 and 3-domain-containing protein [Copromyces sp. CBS 386.78]|nr:class II histone deacetylase complex subunits 2 and 3-domain-containing protein [Copromyces sp. CBS 386.78]
MPRGRPRKSPKAKKPKKESSETFYKVRRIAGEKTENGRLFYYIDWANDPNTGESFKPTWEPAEYVTEAAIAHWELTKDKAPQSDDDDTDQENKAQDEEDEEDELPIVRRRQKRKLSQDRKEAEEQQPRKRARTADAKVKDNTGANPRVKPVKIAVEIPREPTVDPSDFVPVIVSSQDSSQPASQHQEPAAPTKEISQRTIPDSQDVGDSLPSLQQETQREPELLPEEEVSDYHSAVEDPDSESAATPSSSFASAQDQSTQSGAEIPSRQIEDHFEVEPQSISFDDQQTTAEEASHQQDLASNLSSSPPGRFLTQVELDWLAEEISSKSGVIVSTSQVVSQNPDNRSQGPANDEPDTTNTTLASHQNSNSAPLQAAQVLLPSSSVSQQLRSQIEYSSLIENSTPSERAAHISRTDSDIVPATLGKEVSGAKNSPSGITESQAPPYMILRILDANQPTKQPHSDKTDRIDREASSHNPNTPPPSSLSPTATSSTPHTPNQNEDCETANFSMDDAFSTETPQLSATETLQRLRDSIYGKQSDEPPTLLTSPASHLDLHTTQPEQQEHQPMAISPANVFPAPHPDPADSWDIQPSGNILHSIDPSPGLHPGSVISNGETISAVEQLRRSLGLPFTPNAPHTELDISPEPVETHDHVASDELPATIAPSDLDVSAGHDALPSHEQIDFDHNNEDMSNTTRNMDSEESEEESELTEFLVTLPMAANSRPQYLETIDKNKAAMEEFCHAFSESHPAMPNDILTAKIDSIFQRLGDLCDLPAYADTIPAMTPTEMMKHAAGTNTKFSFIYEFLHLARDLNLRVLILCRPGRTFDYLEAVVSTPGFNYNVLGRDGPSSPDETSDGLWVVLASSDQDLSAVHGPIDVAIKFDHETRSTRLPSGLVPVVLSLVVSYTLEHVDLQLSQMEHELSDLEKKNALTLAIVTPTARRLFVNPPDDGHEPHKAAELFACFLQNPDNDLSWDPQVLPADVFDGWLNSQNRMESAQHVLPSRDATGRKRYLDEVDAGTPKRVRLSQTQTPRNSTPSQMTDLLRSTLEKYPGRPATQFMEVSVEQLEALAFKIFELESDLEREASDENRTRLLARNLGVELDSYKRTVEVFTPKYTEALHDRSTFEKTCKKAVDDNAAAQRRLEASKHDLETAKAENKALEAKLAEANSQLANSSNPDLSRLALAEQELSETKTKLAALEKRMVTTTNEMEYSRSAYQNASNAHTELNNENVALKRKVEELERKASENVVTVNQINADQEKKFLGKQNDEYRALIRDRERELEVARAELRHLKSGRRETRQASVPRSPRTTTGIMSPRTTAGRRNANNNTTDTAASSRGNSPAPGNASDGNGNGGMNFNPRWGHLRD